MKKTVSFLLALVLFFSVCLSSASACFESPQPETSQNSIIEFLADAGLPPEFLAARSDGELDALYDLAQTYTLHYSSPKDEGMTFGTIPDSDMVLYPHFISACSPKLPGKRSELTLVVVYVDYAWRAGHPLVHREDAISVNWQSDLFQFMPDQFNSTDYVKCLDTEYSYNIQHNPAKLGLGGLGYYADLMYRPPNVVSGSLQYRGSASFALEPKRTIYAETGNKSQITVEYVHHKNPVGSISFSYNGVSITPGVLQDSVGKAINIDYSF